MLKKVRATNASGIVAFIDPLAIVEVQDTDQNAATQDPVTIRYAIGASMYVSKVAYADGLKLIDGTWA